MPVQCKNQQPLRYWCPSPSKHLDWATIPELHRVTCPATQQRLWTHTSSNHYPSTPGLWEQLHAPPQVKICQCKLPAFNTASLQGMVQQGGAAGVGNASIYRALAADQREKKPCPWQPRSHMVDGVWPLEHTPQPCLCTHLNKRMHALVVVGVRSWAYAAAVLAAQQTGHAPQDRCCPIEPWQT